MRTLLVAGLMLQAIAQPDARLEAFKKWLDHKYPGYARDQGPERFRNESVERAYPGRRFYYVLTHARGIGPVRNGLSLVAEVDERGAVWPFRISSPVTFRRGLRPVTTSVEARRTATAVLTLALGDPGPWRRKVEEAGFSVERTKDGWVCTYSFGLSYVSRVTFDRQGLVSGITVNTPPVG